MADETGSQNTPQGGTQPPSIDYGKIEDMIQKGTQQRESTILEGYFKQLGMSGEELQTAVQDFKTKRATQAKEKETSYQNAQQEIISECCCQLAEFAHENADVLESIVSGYSIDGASLTLSGSSTAVETVSGICLPRAVYRNLCQTGLCCRSETRWRNAIP